MVCQHDQAENGGYTGTVEVGDEGGSKRHCEEKVVLEDMIRACQEHHRLWHNRHHPVFHDDDRKKGGGVFGGGPWKPS